MQTNRNHTVVQQQSQRKVKGIADVIFLLDRSGSMAPCIEAVKQHVGEFITALSSDQRIASVDWRIGFVAFDESDFYVQNFTKDVEKFKASLRSFDTGGNELTLPALDVALDLSWRDEAQRIVIIFTDEPLEGGERIDFQLSRFQDLLSKIVNLSVKLYYYGPECPAYGEFQKLPGSCVQFVDLHSGGLSTTDFAKALEQMGKTISKSLGARVERTKSVPKDLYNLRNHVAVHFL